MVLASPTGVTALVVAKSVLEEAQWQLVIDRLCISIIGSLCPTLSRQNSEQRSLDSANLKDSRVAELSIAGDCPPVSLEECRRFRISPPIHALEEEFTVEVIVQPRELYAVHKMPGLAVFDMDSTLIQQEVIDELARAVGLYEQVAAITEAAMRGEPPYTDFEASLRARVALLKGVPISIWDKLRKEVITFTPGVPETARALKALGWKIALLSGGFTPLAMWVKDTLGLDFAHANQLVSDDTAGVLTGELVPGAPIVHGQRKQDLLLQIASENGIPTQRTIAVGDGSNDLLMMSVAGLGVAFNAKPKVQQAAPIRLNSGSMLDLMHILGYTKREVDGMLGS